MGFFQVGLFVSVGEAAMELKLPKGIVLLNDYFSDS